MHLLSNLSLRVAFISLSGRWAESIMGVSKKAFKSCSLLSGLMYFQHPKSACDKLWGSIKTCLAGKSGGGSLCDCMFGDLCWLDSKRHVKPNLTFRVRLLSCKSRNCVHKNNPWHSTPVFVLLAQWWRFLTLRLYRCSQHGRVITQPLLVGG